MAFGSELAKRRSSWCRRATQGLAGPTLGVSQLPRVGWGLWDLRGECARRGAGNAPTLGPPAWEALRTTQVTACSSLRFSFLDSQNAVLILKNSRDVRLSVNLTLGGL